MEDLQKAGETINRFFTRVGNFVRDAASSMYQTAKVSWAASIGDKQGIQSGVNQMITESQEQAHYIASGDIVDDLQTPEGMGYAAAAIATVYVTKKIKLGGARTIEQVLDNPKLLESMHPTDFKKNVKLDENWKEGTLRKGQ